MSRFGRVFGGLFRRPALRVAAVLMTLLLSAGAWAAAPQADAASHGHEAHGEHHVPHWSDVNWFYGLVAEREGVEPSLLWRPPGMPVPVAALVLNTAILFWLFARFGGPLVRSGLKSRRERVERGIQSAAAMKAEAEEQLAHYEGKLKRIDQEIERVRTEMREQGEAERKRVLADAKVRQEQLERDVQVLLAQELKAAREQLFQDVVAESVRAAEETLRKELSAADQQRLADEFLASIDELVRIHGRAVGSPQESRT